MGKGEHAKVVLTTGTLTGRNAIKESPSHIHSFDFLPFVSQRNIKLSLNGKE